MSIRLHEARYGPSEIIADKYGKDSDDNILARPPSPGRLPANNRSELLSDLPSELAARPG